MTGNSTMKYVILVGDGMGDLPMAELAGRTPLDAAHTPAMDQVARQGELLLLQTIPPGYPPGSDVANLSLMGYTPGECYTGRAPLEAASMGVALGPDDIAFRCNLVTLDFQTGGAVVMEDYSAGHISTEEARELINAIAGQLNDDRVRFYPGVSYRHLMVHTGSVNGLATVPPHDYIGRNVAHKWDEYQRIGHFRELCARARDILDRHPVNKKRRAAGKPPANAIWLWGQGRAPVMPTLQDRFGRSGALVSAVDLLKGIGVYAGMEILDVPGATGYLDTNYQGKVAAALDALDRHDFVLVHVEAPDEAGHEGSLEKKLQAIEAFDGSIVQPIVRGLEQRKDPYRLAVAMDHFTPLSLRTHTTEPVPVALMDSRRRRDSGMRYTEECAGKNVSTTIDGRTFFRRFLEAL